MRRMILQLLRYDKIGKGGGGGGGKKGKKSNEVFLTFCFPFNILAQSYTAVVVGTLKAAVRGYQYDDDDIVG